MPSTWALFLQIETASVGNNFGGSRLNHDTKGGGYMFWTNRNRVQWGWIDQASRWGVGGHRQTHRKHESKTCRRLFLKAN
jgi:hypothetical protein